MTGLLAQTPSVNEGIATSFERLEERWRGGGRRRHLCHVLASILVEVRMMWRLEDVNFTIPTFGGRNTQT